MKTYPAVGATLVCAALIYESPGMAQTWMQTGAPAANWESVCCSADGRKIVAAGWLPDPSGFFSSGIIYRSTNSGAAWTSSEAPSEPWSAVVCSADGSRVLVASQLSTIVAGGGIYLSTESGLNWTLTGAPQMQDYASLASSADGTNIAAAIYAYFTPEAWPGTIYSSTNGGYGWTGTGLSGFLRTVSCSADGNYLISGGNYDTRFGNTTGIYTSGNAGTSWSLSALTLVAPMCVASSADRSKVFAAGLRSGIYRSTDGGESWIETSAPVLGWTAVACSVDGERLIATSASNVSFNPGLIYASTNSGTNWTQASAPDQNWVAVASSADGCRLFAAANGGGIYTCQTTPAPALNIRQCGNSVLLSWIVPSTPFRLQESADLANWSGVGISPVLNYTNLHYEVSLTPLTDATFYRLAQQP